MTEYVVVDKIARRLYYGPGPLAKAKAYAAFNNRAEPGCWAVRTLAHANRHQWRSKGPLETITKRDREWQRRGQ